jgi:hypothetical protein
VIDVTNKADLRLIGLLRYPNYSYCHQGWLSADRRYLFLGDEGDEQRYNLPATTYVIDVADPAAPTLAATFTTGLNSIDHNMMVRGRFLFEANYTTGLRVFDVQDVHNAVEVGYFDTFPASDDRTFEGAWGAYAGFPSGTVLISDIVGGLFVFDVKEATGCQANAECNDRNPCTADACTVNGTCVNTPLPLGASCEDGDPCTTDGICDRSGTCISMEVVGRPCETNDDCFPGVCILATGECACESCVRALPPAALSTPVAKNRYLSLRPRNPGVQAALRVTLADPPPLFASCKGSQFWVGRPVAVSERSGYRDDSPPTFLAAALSSEPFFADWGAMGTIHVYGRGITPGGSYRIEAVSASCWSIGVANFSFPLVVGTSRWGDVVGICSPNGCTAPDGSVFVATDAMAVVDKFMNRPQAVSKTWTDVDPETPDQVVTIVDLLRVLDAYRGESYPFHGPPGCE